MVLKDAGCGVPTLEDQPGNPLRLDRSFIDQHDRDVFFDRIDPVTLMALQTLRVRAILERLLARRTYQNFEELFGNHDSSIVRQGDGRRLR
jgi:hypothetical protein